MGLFSNEEKKAQQAKRDEVLKKYQYNMGIDRFCSVYDKGGVRIIFDIVTGINYLYLYDSQSLYGNSISITNTITPLLDTDGKPIVLSKEQIKELLEVLR